MTDKQRGDRGFVLLFVLLISGLIALLVSATLIMARSGVGFARLSIDTVQADGLIEGGIEATAYQLFQGKLDIDDINGNVLNLWSGKVTLDLTDEAGRINLNAADAVLLEGLYTAVGAVGMQAQEFSSRVLDWRDEDDEATEDGGAERLDYAAAGVEYEPRNARFESVAELNLLLGMTADDFEALAPHLTVYAEQSQINLHTAGRTVLSAIPGMTEENLEKIIEIRTTGNADFEDFIDTLEDGAELVTEDPGPAYRVTVTAALPNGFQKSAQAVIVASKDKQMPYLVLAWRE